MAVLKRCDCGGVGVCPVCLREDRDEALAEVKGLREQLASEVWLTNELHREMDALRAEVERLRDALTRIATPNYYGKHDILKMVTVAREALDA